MMRSVQWVTLPMFWEKKDLSAPYPGLNQSKKNSFNFEYETGIDSSSRNVGI